MNDDSNVPTRINRYWEQKREKLDEITLWIKNEIREYEPHTEEADGEAVVKSLTQVIEKLERFKEEEL